MAEAFAQAELMHRAARGDREAQADLTAFLIGDQEYPQAEAIARLAVMHGDANDCLLLSAILLLRYGQEGDGPTAMAFYQEAFAVFDLAKGYGSSKGLQLLGSVLSALAERGNDHAALWLEQLIAPLSPAEAGSLNEFVGGVRSLAAALNV